jgi:integrase
MEARAARDAWVTLVRTGGVPVLERATVAAQAWLRHVAERVEAGELRPRTLESYTNGINHHVTPRLGQRQLSSITPEDLVAWHRSQRIAGASQWTIRARWMALRGLLAYAARYGWIPVNPADQLLAEERPKPGEANHRYLSREEIALLLEHSEDRALIATALFTGMRASEILGLVWGDVDFDVPEIRVRFQMSRQGHRVPLKTRAGRSVKAG